MPVYTERYTSGQIHPRRRARRVPPDVVNFFFTPLNSHFDAGFGAIGDSFKDAADRLRRGLARRKSWQNGHLPVNYLYRHAVELFLKSMISIVHRRLRVPYGKLPHDGVPHIPFTVQSQPNGKPGQGPPSPKVDWRPITKVHQVSALYQHLKEVVIDNEGQLDKICRTKWAKFPAELDANIQRIAQADDGSTYSRYPNLKDSAQDHAKSSFKKSTMEKLLSKMGPEGPYQRGFVILDQNEQVREVFQGDDQPLAELSKALRQAADTLSGAHFGFRMELAGGW